MLVCVRWHAVYPLSLRNLEEMMEERGGVVDHTAVHRWALKMLPVLATMLHPHKRSVGRERRQHCSLAGTSPARCRGLPSHRITAHSGVYNCRF